MTTFSENGKPEPMNNVKFFGLFDFAKCPVVIFKHACSRNIDSKSIELFKTVKYVHKKGNGLY